MKASARGIRRQRAQRIHKARVIVHKLAVQLEREKQRAAAIERIKELVPQMDGDALVKAFYEPEQGASQTENGAT